MKENREFSPQPPDPKGKIGEGLLIKISPYYLCLTYHHKESADSARARSNGLQIFISSKWLLEPNRLN